MSNSIFGLDRDENGVPLPTQRNKDIFDKLIKKYGSKEMLMLKHEDDYGPYVNEQVMEPLPATKRDEKYYEDRYKKVAELDRDYLTEKNLVNRIEIKQANIVDLKVDAIVNAAAADLQGGGGVDWSIHEAAGQKLFNLLDGHEPIKPGESVITPGFDLPAKYIIHTLGPIYTKPSVEKDNQLENCYISSLLLAEKNKVKSIAFCLISAGIFGYPKELAAKLALKGIAKYFESFTDSKINKVIMVGYTDEDFKVIKKVFGKYLPTN